jgi:hypothetical protein
MSGSASEATVVIYRSANRDGQTFELRPQSARILRDAFPQVHRSPRIFIAHETLGDYEQMLGDFAPQVITLLTGVSEQMLAEKGFRISFVDPVTERELRAHA